MTASLTLERTREALLEHDRLRERWYQVFDGAPSGPGGVAEWSEELDRLDAQIGVQERLVSEAFAEDTADRNSRENALLVRPCAWLRKAVAGPGAVVHSIQPGSLSPACGYGFGSLPSTWPREQTWAQVGEREVNCPGCLGARRR